MHIIDTRTKLALERFLGQSITDISVLSGGDISRAFKVSTASGDFFYKEGDGTSSKAMFSTERKGLILLEESQTIAIPKNIGLIEGRNTFGLCMEYIPKSSGSKRVWEDFGSQLSQMHRISDDSFGLNFDNYIGRLHQSNKRHITWTDFYAAERILPQVKLAIDHDLLEKKDLIAAEGLCLRIGDWYPEEPPALLHGDLWSGNYLIGPDDTVYLIDPAPYFGHREMDLSMTLLFGGFPDVFYEAYEQTFPLHPGWRTRVKYGQLFYLLVHLNLFGISYLSSVRESLGPFYRH